MNINSKYDVIIICDGKKLYGNKTHSLHFEFLGGFIRRQNTHKTIFCLS